MPKTERIANRAGLAPSFAFRTRSRIEVAFRRSRLYS
jgi:hypothetical protein